MSTNQTAVYAAAATETREPLTEAARLLGLIWTKHHRLNNWTLETKTRHRHPRYKWLIARCYGWAELCWATDLYKAILPQPERRQRAEPGQYATLDEALRAVELSRTEFYV
jgi:hypothetical protein